KMAGECIRRLLEQLRIRELLVVGVDLAWDQAILSALPLNLEMLWFINEDDHVKDHFIATCGNIKNFYYLTGHKGNYDVFFKLLYWNINQSITESHKLVEDLKSDIHNMKMDLQHIRKRSDETDAAIKVLQTKMDSLISLVEVFSDNKRLEEES